MKQRLENIVQAKGDFREEIAKYFIENGRYNINYDKAKTLNDIQPFIYANIVDFKGVHSDRDRENNIGREELSKKRAYPIIEEKIEEQIKKGKSLELYLNGIVKPKVSWKRKEIRIYFTKKLVKYLKKPVTNTNSEDFKKNGLDGLLKNYKSSVYLALKEAGHNILPWEMKNASLGFYQKKDNRIKVMKWLVKKTKKPIYDIDIRDFRKNGLNGLIQCSYKNSAYSALKEAGYKIEPWEMKSVPKGTWKAKYNRIEAIKRLVNKLNKPAFNIIEKDFIKNGLGGLIDYYKNTIYLALKEAGYVKSPYEMKNMPKCLEK